MHPPKHFPFSLHSTPKDNFHETLSERYATRLGMADRMVDFKAPVCQLASREKNCNKYCERFNNHSL